jgi:hypothetical protein
MERRVLVQGTMSPRLIIIGSIRAYDSAQVRFTEYDHVVQAPRRSAAKFAACIQRFHHCPSNSMLKQRAHPVDVLSFVPNVHGSGHRRNQSRPSTYRVCHSRKYCLVNVARECSAVLRSASEGLVQPSAADSGYEFRRSSTGLSRNAPQDTQTPGPT